MIGVNFNIGPSRDAIRRAIALVNNMTPVYEDIGEYLLDQHKRRFVEGKAPDGTSWAPKSEATLARYKRLGYGTLNSPLIGPSRLLSRMIQRYVSRDGVIIGSAQIYSRVMQEGAAEGAFGTNRRGQPLPWGRIPAREWLGMSAGNDAAVIEIVEEHLEDALRQA
ncbi:MAG: phage virion morphogenesis protein [Sphingomonadaceae bacterium]